MSPIQDKEQLTIIIKEQRRSEQETRYNKEKLRRKKYNKKA